MFVLLGSLGTKRGNRSDEVARIVGETRVDTATVDVWKLQWSVWRSAKAYAPCRCRLNDA